ncbi:MAG: DUF898 family protein [Helicobacteraceae bacterium]|nr:DUF898 family protein [Helicobacteraceae bacterium]
MLPRCSYFTRQKARLTLGSAGLILTTARSAVLRPFANIGLESLSRSISLIFFALFFSCGLLYPWAKVRVLKYKLENVGFENLDLDDFTGEIERQKGALGEETADFFDLDIGF